jgi:uncharacterized protein DUF3551
MMRRFIISGLAVSAALMVASQAQAGSWCRLAREAGGMECSFNSFSQCAASTERLNGGGCVENPRYHGGSTSADARHVVRQMRRRDDTNR